MYYYIQNNCYLRKVLAANEMHCTTTSKITFCLNQTVKLPLQIQSEYCQTEFPTGVLTHLLEKTI